MKKNKKRTKKILIIAGGGCFGIIPITLLKSLSILDIREHIDCIAGTSVGSIISIYLARGFSPYSLHFKFKKAVPKIFKKSFFGFLNPLAGYKYPAENIEKFLKETFKKDKLKDIRNIDLLVPAVNFKTEKPKVFDNIVDRDDMELELWKIARSSSAAPTYFPPFVNEDGNIYIDGGIIENAPIISTISALIHKNPGLKFEDMRVLVLGTGKNKVKEKNGKIVKSYSKLDWLNNLLLPFATKSNEICSQFWASQLPLQYFKYYNPIEIEGEMDDYTIVNKYEKETNKKTSEFKKIWNEFIGG